jgi:hypothetical protein
MMCHATQLESTDVHLNILAQVNESFMQGSGRRICCWTILRRCSFY